MTTALGMSAPTLPADPGPHTHSPNGQRVSGSAGPEVTP